MEDYNSNANLSITCFFHNADFSAHVAEFFPIQVFYVADFSSPVFNVAPSQQGDVVWMLPEEKRQPRLLGI